MTVRQKSARRKSPHSRRKSRRNMRKSTSTRGKTARKSKSLRHGYHRMLRGGEDATAQEIKDTISSAQELVSGGLLGDVNETKALKSELLSQIINLKKSNSDESLNALRQTIQKVQTIKQQQQEQQNKQVQQNLHQPINTQQQQQQHEQVKQILDEIPLLITTQEQQQTQRDNNAAEATELARLQSNKKKQFEEKLDTKRRQQLQEETQKLNEEAILNIQHRNAITAVTKLESLLENITNDDDKTHERNEQFTAIMTFFGDTLNERKQGKIKTILRSDEDNKTKAASILQAIAGDKKSRDSMYALLGLGGAAAAYMLGRKHGVNTEKRQHSSSKNRRG